MFLWCATLGFISDYFKCPVWGTGRWHNDRGLCGRKVTTAFSGKNVEWLYSLKIGLIFLIHNLKQCDFFLYLSIYIKLYNNMIKERLTQVICVMNTGY